MTMSSTPRGLSWTVTEMEAVVVVELAGEMDVQSVRALSPSLHQLGTSAPRLVLDMSGVKFCDSAGVNVLIIAYRAAKESGGWVRLVGLQPQVHRVYEVSGLASVMPEFPSVDAALADESQAEPA